MKYMSPAQGKNQNNKRERKLKKGKKKRPGKERVHATLGTLSGITGTFEDTGIKEA